MTNPNDELFTTLGFVQTYRRAFAIIRRELGAFLCLTCCIVVPMVALILVINLYFTRVTTSDTTEQNFGLFAAALAVEFCLIILLIPIAQGSLMQLVLETYVGYSPGGWSCVKKAIHRLPTLICYNIVVMMIAFASIILPAFMIGLYGTTGSNVWLVLGIIMGIICIVWIIYFTLSLICAMPAILAEGSSATASMWQSRYLAGGHYCYIFSVMLVIIVLNYAIMIVFGPWANIAVIVLLPLHAV